MKVFEDAFWQRTLQFGEREGLRKKDWNSDKLPARRVSAEFQKDGG